MLISVNFTQLSVFANYIIGGKEQNRLLVLYSRRGQQSKTTSLITDQKYIGLQLAFRRKINVAKRSDAEYIHSVPR